MATFRGISAATLGTGALAAGGYSAYEFNQDGFLDKGKGALAGVGAAGLGAGALKVALGGMGRGRGREYAEGIASRSARKGAARMNLGAGLGIAALGLGVKAGYDIKNGNEVEGMKYGAGASVAGYAAYKSVSSGRKANATAEGIRTAIKIAGSEAGRNAKMMKLGAGIAVTGLGLGAKAYHDFKEGDTTDGLKYGAGAVGAGVLSKAAFKTGLHSRAKSKAIDGALDAAQKYAIKAVKNKKFGHKALVGAGIGTLIAGGGVMTQDRETMAAGAGIAGVGALVASASYNSASRNRGLAATSIDTAREISTTPRKVLAETARRAKRVAKEGGRRVAQDPGFLGRTSYGGRSSATVAELAESVTRLRKANSRTGKVAAGFVGLAALGTAFMGYGLLNG